MSLNNLKAEIKRIGITQQSVADFLEMGLSNFNRKLAESVPFTNHEMYDIRDKFFPDMSIDYLFRSDGNVPPRAEPHHTNMDPHERLARIKAEIKAE